MKKGILYLVIICLVVALATISVILYSNLQPKYCNSKKDIVSKLEGTHDQYGKVKIAKTVDYKEYRIVGFNTDNNSIGYALLEKINGKDYSLTNTTVDGNDKYPIIQQVVTNDGDVIVCYVIFNTNIKKIEISDSNDKIIKQYAINDTNRNAGYIKMKNSENIMYSFKCIDAEGKTI